MADDSPLAIYKKLFGESEALKGRYSGAMDEQRQAASTSMTDLEDTYRRRPSSGLLALAEGLSAPGPGGFIQAYHSGLKSYRKSREDDSDKDIERAQKLAALRGARAKLTETGLDNERQILEGQRGIAGGLQTIKKDEIAETRARAEEQRGEMLLRALGITGDGGSATPPPPPGPEGWDSGGEGEIVNESEDDLSFGQTTPPPSQRPPMPAPPAQAPGRPPMPAIQLTDTQKMLIAAEHPAKRAALLATMLANRSQTESQKVAEREKIAVERLQLQPGTPAYNQYIATGQMPQPRDATRAVSELRAIREADTNMGKYEDAERSLLEAYNLIPKAWNRMGGQTAATIGEFFGQGEDKNGAVYATKQLNTILSEEAIKAMGDALTGASTDYEMKKFLELYADGSASATRKQEALKRVIEKITRQKLLAQEQSKGLRSGEYYKPGYEPPKAPTGERGEPAGAKNAPGGSDPYSAADAILKGGAQ